MFEHMMANTNVSVSVRPSKNCKSLHTRVMHEEMVNGKKIILVQRIVNENTHTATTGEEERDREG